MSLYYFEITLYIVIGGGEVLTDETEARLGQVRPLKDGVEDVLSFTVQLVHLIQNQQPDEQTQTQSHLVLELSWKKVIQHEKEFFRYQNL